MLKLSAIIFLVVFLCHYVKAINNEIPYLSNVPYDQSIKFSINNQPKDINQWNVAVLVPPSGQLPKPSGNPPSAAAPGYVWLQVPASYAPNDLPSALPPPPPISTTSPPTLIPGIQQPPITIEPPIILDLNKKCLKPRGQFPSNSCNNFVNCWDGVAVEQSCPKELVFNPVKLFCDYPENVNCNGKPIVAIDPPSTGDATTPGQSSTAPPTNPPTTASPPTVQADPVLKKKCLKPRGQFRSNSCNKYVNCWDDVVIEQECPEGLLFSDKGYCDFASRVNCNDGSLTVVPIKPQQKNECPIEYGMFRNAQNCSIYYTCVQSKIVATYECPVGYSFNDNIGVCDHSYRVDCTKDSIGFQMQKMYYESAKDGNSIHCPTEYGFYRDQHNCSIYYSCLAYQVVAKYECPEGFNFNENLGVCDYSNRVDCTKEPSYNQYKDNTFVPQIPPDFMDKIDGCTPGKVFRLNPQCTVACRCREGLAEIIQCPDGLAYDSPIDKCIPIHLARC